MALPNAVRVEAVVVEALPNGTYVLRLQNGHRLIGWWPRKGVHPQLRPDDRVVVEVRFYDLSHGRLLEKIG